MRCTLIQKEKKKKKKKKNKNKNALRAQWISFFDIESFIKHIY